MDFFDEDDQEQRPERRTSGPSGHDPAIAGGAGPPVGPAGGPTPQQIRARRAGAAVAGVVVLILLVVAFRGCLDARQERGFQNYVSDLSALTTETDQLSSGFFDRLRRPEDLDDISLESEVDGDRGTAQALLDRAAGLEAPDEVAGAQEQILLSYELRHDALVGIASQLETALGRAGSERATRAIGTQMKVLSASDILFARARDQIEQVLTDEEIVVEGGVPDSQFLPKDPDYLDPAVVEDVIAGLGGESGGGNGGEDPDDGLVHGLGLVSSVLLPSGTALEPGVPVTAGDGDNEIQVDVQNQGEADESDIGVEVSGDGVGGNEAIDEIAAGETQSVSIPLRPAPSGPVELTVTVDTVPGEQVADNNEATYSVTFP